MAQSNNPTHKQYWLNLGFSESEASLKIKEKRIVCKEYWINKGFTKEESIQKANEFAKTRNKYCKEYWINKGFNENESIDKIKTYKNSIIHFKLPRISNILCKEYWIKKGFTENESIKKIIEEQTRRFKYDAEFSKKISEGRILANKKLSKSQLIEREKRNKIHSLRMKSKNGTHSPIFKEYWINKGLTEEEAILKANNIKFAGYCKCYSSKGEKELIKNLNLNIVTQKLIIINLKQYIPDGIYKNFYIEYNGTFFHLDPRFYSVKDKNPYKKSYKDIRKYDNKKINDYFNSGKNVIVVWEYDYKNNKEYVLTKVKDLLNETDKKRICWDSSGLQYKCK